MGILSEPDLDRLVSAGCTRCGSKKLTFRTYVDGLLPIMGAEPVGKITWVYDGEKFVDGVFEVRCTDCKQVVFSETVCPRCHAPGGLERALATPNGFTVPTQCPKCEGEELRYIAFLPARVAYEGTRAEKARTTTELLDNGFHGYRVDCKSCGTVTAPLVTCPLCDASGPLRERPG